MNKSHCFVTLWKMLPILWAASFFVSCTNDMATINRLLNPADEPDFAGEHATVLYSDSAHLKIKVEAPVIERFSGSDSAQTLFREGLQATFYDREQREENSLKADWARLDEAAELWEARGHVVIKQTAGDSLLTDVLFWDQHEGCIYNESDTRIFSEGTFYQCHEGIEAAQDFSWWRCNSSTGEIELKEAPPALQDSLPADSMQAMPAAPPVAPVVADSTAMVLY